MDRTITVKGVGRFSAKPDLIVMPLTLNIEYESYQDALQHSEQALEQLRDALLQAGFQQDDLKTSDFRVEPVYRNVNDNHGNYSRKMHGYRCTHLMKVQFDWDPQRMNEVLTALTNCPAKPDFSVEFTIKDTQRAKSLMLAAAAQDAHEKAQLLCAASGAILGKLVHIDYSWNDIAFVSPTDFSMPAAAPRAAMMDLVPEDVENHDSATFTWEIM